MDKNFKLTSVTTDWEAYEKAIAERWISGKHLYYCKKHETTFDYLAEDSEPCWQCYNEFTKEL